MANPTLTDSLMLLARGSNTTLQKVIVKIIYCMTEHSDQKIQALNSNLDQVLLHIKHNASDKEVWNMADTGTVNRYSQNDKSSANF